MGNVEYTEDGSAIHRKSYEWKNASATIAGTDPTVDLATKTGFTALFDTVPNAHYIKLEVASGTAYFRLNADSNDVITVTATSPYESEVCIVRKIYAATGGSAVSITVKLN